MILVTNNEGTLGVPTTARMLAEGAPALDAIEAGIRLIEADPTVRTVGRGGWPNLLGELELDACVMDGTTLRTGAVGALQGYLASGQRRPRDHAPAAARIPGGRGRRALRPRDRRASRRQPDRGFAPCLAGLVRQRGAGRTEAGLAGHSAGRVVPPRDRSGDRPRHHGVPGARRRGQYLLRHQHVRLGLEISRPSRRQPDRRRRLVRRHALRRRRLHRCRRDDDPLLHRPLDRALHEKGRQRRRRGAARRSRTCAR